MDRQLTVDTNEAVMPICRPLAVAKHHMERVTFQYYTEVTTHRTRTTTADDGKTAETTKDELVSTQERKIKLLQWTKSVDEDAEHCFEAFAVMRQELKHMVDISKDSVTTDAQVLFDATEHFLGGQAVDRWRDTLRLTDESGMDRTLRQYKLSMAHFISEHVLIGDGSYVKQKRYLENRNLIRGLDVRTWRARLETLSGYLPFFFGSLEALKQWYPSAHAGTLWTVGQLSQAEISTILATRIPQAWIIELEKHDYNQKLRLKSNPDELCMFLQACQAQEERMMNTRGRGPTNYYRGGGRRSHSYGREPSNRREMNNRRETRNQREMNYGRGSYNRNQMSYLPNQAWNMYPMYQQPRFYGNRGVPYSSSSRFGGRRSFGRGRNPSAGRIPYQGQGRGYNQPRNYPQGYQQSYYTGEEQETMQPQLEADNQDNSEYSDNFVAVSGVEDYPEDGIQELTDQFGAMPMPNDPDAYLGVEDPYQYNDPYDYEGPFAGDQDYG